jgi:hypothetical protein
LEAFGAWMRRPPLEERCSKSVGLSSPIRSESAEEAVMIASIKTLSAGVEGRKEPSGRNARRVAFERSRRPDQRTPDWAASWRREAMMAGWGEEDMGVRPLRAGPGRREGKVSGRRRQFEG